MARIPVCVSASPTTTPAAGTLARRLRAWNWNRGSSAQPPPATPATCVATRQGGLGRAAPLSHFFGDAAHDYGEVFAGIIAEGWSGRLALKTLQRPATTRSAPRACVPDAIDRAGVVIRNQHRAVREYQHIGWSAPGSFTLQPTSDEGLV